jgi:ELWxxDGT repeat protein
MMPIDRIFALALGRRPGARRSAGRPGRRGPRREASRLSAQALEPRVVFAGIPSFVADINRTTPGSMPADFTVIGQTAFFSADDGKTGTELFRTDGTSAGTIRILDLNPGAEGSFPRELTAVGGTLFFLADVDGLGSQLFRSDGTAAGTVRVEDVGSGSGPVQGLPLPRNAFNLTAAGTSLYFCADDGSKGVELWVSDGTRAGTTVVADIAPGSPGSFPSELTSFGTRLVFSADDGTHGRELWVSDGTLAGTFMVGDLNPDIPDSSPTGMTVVGPQLFFAATGFAIGRELYRWDGSDNGLILVADIVGTEGSSDPQNLTAVGAALFFTADAGGVGRELWTSDGTAAGTRLVADITAGSDSSQPTDLTAVGDTLFFTVSIPSPLGSRSDLWRSRGTEADTVRITAPSVPGGFALPRRLTAMGNELFFFAGGQQLLKAGPSSTQATLVRDIDPTQTANDVTSASYGAMAVLGGKLLFGADDGQSGDELWISDGTTANTGLLRDIRSSVTNDGLDSSASFAAVAVNGTLYFAADDGIHGMELWKTDGTAAGTVLVKDIATGRRGSDPRDAVVVGSTVFFVADDGVHGAELWKTDGTAAGTVLVKDIVTGGDAVGFPIGSFPNDLTPFGSNVLFAADDLAHGRELWISDGTAAGTRLVADINLDTTFGGNSYPTELTPFGKIALFRADDGIHGMELWATDGTTAGTRLVADIHTGPSFDGGSYPEQFAVLGSFVLFSAFDVTHGIELWRTDGTTAGTRLVADIDPGDLTSFPHAITPFRSFALFAATRADLGTELWRTDGTAAGTTLVLDINDSAPGTDSSPSDLAVYEDRVYFAATTAAAGRELWRSDGTAVGTTLVKDILPGAESSNPYAIVTAPGPATAFCFIAFTGSGTALFESDGTAAGTAPVELAPGFSGTNQSILGVAGDSLFFGIDDAVHGNEPWRLTIRQNQPPAVVATTPIPAGLYRAGDVLTFTVQFNEPVTVTGFPFVGLTIGSRARRAYYVGGSGTTALRFRHVVQPGDNDADGITIARVISLNGGTIQGVGRTPALLDLPVIDATAVRVDTTPPRILAFASTTANGTYGIGATIVIRATASEPVRAGAVFPVTLDTGAVVQMAAITAGNSLQGVYTVAAGQASPRLTVVSFKAGTVLDLAGNAMQSVQLPAGAANLGGSSLIVIDTRPALAPAVFAAGGDGRPAGWAPEYGYTRIDATTLRIAGLSAAQAGFFTPGMPLAVTPAGAATPILATVQAATHDAATRSITVRIDRELPASPLRGTVLIGYGDVPAARLVSVGTGATVREVMATDLLAAAYTRAFTARFQGGLRVTTADFDGNGVPDVVTAPGAVPDRADPGTPGGTLAEAFGSSLARVAIFDGAGSNGWSPVTLNLAAVFGDRPAGGLLVAAGDLRSDAAGSGVVELVVASATKLAIYDVLVAAPGARPSIRPTPLQVIDVAGTLTGMTVGRFFTDGGRDDVVTALASLASRSTTVEIRSGATLGLRTGFVASTTVESGPSHALVDVFSAGAALAAGDFDGDSRQDLALGAGTGGLANFRILGNEVLTSPLAQTNPAGFAQLVGGQLATTGRFGQPRIAGATWRPLGGPDFYTPGDASGPTGGGINSPLSLVAAGRTADGRTRLFAALGATNQTPNAVREFAFRSDVGWTAPFTFSVLDANPTGARFRIGSGLRLG